MKLSPIIERPEWQSFRQRTLYAVITLLFWGIWIYLWRPLFDLLCWILGLHPQAYSGSEGEHYQSLLHLFAIYLLIIAVLGGSLLLWALYNYLRFRGVERRRARPALDTADQGRHYTLDPALLQDWQLERRLVVHHDRHSNVIGVEGGAVPWLRPEPPGQTLRRMPHASPPGR